MARKLRTKPGRKAYSRRKTIVELAALAGGHSPNRSLTGTSGATTTDPIDHDQQAPYSLPARAPSFRGTTRAEAAPAPRPLPPCQWNWVVYRRAL